MRLCPSKMKGVFYGLKSSQISLILISFACTTVFLWAWEKTQNISALLPPQNQLLQISPEMARPIVASSITVNQHEHVGEDTSQSSEKEMLSDQEEPLAVTDPMGSGKSSHNKNDDDEDLVRSAVDRKEEKVKENHIIKAESNGTISTMKSEQGRNFTQSLAENSKEEHDVDVVMGSKISSYSGSQESNTNLTLLSENQACTYTKGKWVVDNNRPLYSGFGCKQWLAPMWACRLTQRVDFTYEKLRWQPRDCQMEDFEGSKFLIRMQNKTLAFVGDSLGRQQFQSLMCMITGGNERPDVLDVGKEYGLVMPPGGTRPDGWAYRFPSTNTTILYYWSASLCDLEPIDIANPATDYALHLDRPPAFLRRYLHKIDVLVLNTGHHWNRGKFKGNRWVMHVGGVRNTDRRLIMIGNAKNFTIHSIVKWVDSQLPKYPGLKAFYRSISPRHFVNGDWNTGGSCDNTSPMSIGKDVLQDESGDYSAASAVKDTGVKLLDITALSQVRDEGHLSRYSIKGTSRAQDCLHWCLPGVPETWNELLFAQLQF